MKTRSRCWGVVGAFSLLTSVAVSAAQDAAPSRRAQATKPAAASAPAEAARPRSAATEPAKEPFKPTWQLALAKLRSESGPIALRGSSAFQTIFVPISPRVILKSALLHVEFTNSISLIKERSQLAVLLNGKVIAQVPLKPNEPEAVLDVRLPVALMKPGYNRLQFRAVHHITDCEDPTSPELWTEIDPVASYLALEGGLRNGRFRLSELADLIDPKLWIWQPAPIRVLTGKRRIGPSGLAQGAIVAQGGALRLDYLPLKISHGVAEPYAEARQLPPEAFRIAAGSFRGMDAVLVGTAADLDAFLPETIKQQIGDAFLGIYPQDSQNGHFVIVVSGRNRKEVTRAATAFAYTHFPLPDAAAMLVKQNVLPEIEDETARRSVHENGMYRFTHFGFRSVTVKGMGAEPFRIELWFPPDLYAKQRADVQLRLHLTYGAGFHPDSVLNVSVNDHFEKAVPLSDPEGAAYRDYRIDIPLRDFRAGNNTLILEARMMPSVTNKCLIFADNLRLTLFDDSLLVMPDASHYVRLPELELVSRTGFPFTARDDGSDLAIHVGGANPRTIAAAWMLAGKLSQQISTPLHDLSVTFHPIDNSRNLVAVGPLERVDKKILEAAPMPLNDLKNVPYPDPIGESVPVRHPGAFARWWPVWESSEAAEPPLAEPTTARVKQVSDFGATVATMMFESPSASKKSVFLVTAGDVQRLSAGVQRLIEAETWDALRGDLVVWRDGPETIAAQQAGKSYYVGHIKFQDRVTYDFSKHPWGLAVLVIVLVALLVWLTNRLLGRMEERRTNVERRPSNE
jgi:cellulose synthase operon protein B